MAFAPLVSVIVPVFNNESYLEQAVDSLLQQTYTNLEVLLVDDGSTDGSGAVCDRIGQRDSRVVVIHKENGGLSSARRTGVEHIRGQYAMIVDSDDWLDPETIGRCVETVAEHGCACVAFSYVREYENRSLPVHVFPASKAFFGADAAMAYRRIWGLFGDEMEHPERIDSFVSCCMKLYSAELLRQARYFDTKVIGGSEDALFNIYALRNCSSLYYLDEPFYHYRKQQGKTLSSTYRPKLIEQYRVLYDTFDMARDELKIDEACRQAYINRTALSVIGIGLNEIKNPKAGDCIRRIRAYITQPRNKAAYRQMQFHGMPFIWKLFFFFVKRGMALTVYCALISMHYLKSRI